MKKILVPKILLFILIVVLGMLYVLYTMKEIESDQSSRVLQIARSVVATFPKEDLKMLRGNPGDVDKPEYRKIKNILIAIIRANPDARFSYLFKEQSGKLYFMADSEQENSKDFSPPGQEYTEASSEDMQPFINGRERITGPLSDRWGTWMSTLTPIKDDTTGKTMAVLGIDYNIKFWQKVFLIEVFESIILTILLLLTVLFLFIVIARNKALAIEVSNRKRGEEEIRKLNGTLEERIAQRTAQLESSNKELAVYTKEIEQYTYIASHDLQEPLRTLTNFTQLLLEEYQGKLDEDGNKYIDFINKAAARMRELVSGLVEYSILGKESLISNVDCNEIISLVLSDLDVSIKVNHANITVRELPRINCYETEMRLLFQNLVVNAIKFRKKNVTPEINISAENTGKEWIFKIEDNGIGIDEKNKEKVFIIFKRMHNRSDYKGAGIGLAHCKKIVELHGGRIWVESTFGEGSIFMFTIPNA
jgi:signal transduction histidine kinase